MIQRKIRLHLTNVLKFKSDDIVHYFKQDFKEK